MTNLHKDIDTILDELIRMPRGITVIPGDHVRAILDAVINALPKEKPGIQDQGLIDKDEPWLGVAKYCKECGDYDSCDCEGYNDALTEVKQLLTEAKESKR